MGVGGNPMVDVQRLRRFEEQVTADWRHLGTQTTESGTRCVGHVTQVAPKAWLHRFYAPLKMADLVQFTDRTAMPIPVAWQEMLLSCNGMILFVSRIILGGIIPDGLLRRSPDDPSTMSLEQFNLRSSRQGDFVVGGCALGAGSDYVLRDERIIKVPQGGGEVLGDWPSLAEMLESEYHWIASHTPQDGTPPKALAESGY